VSTVDWIPNEITAAARQRNLEAGESLFRQGDKTYGIFAILKGRVQMIRYDSHGRSLVQQPAGPSPKPDPEQRLIEAIRGLTVRGACGEIILQLEVQS
jgi:CRP-like cAMP-binding protein